MGQNKSEMLKSLDGMNVVIMNLKRDEDKEGVLLYKEGEEYFTVGDEDFLIGQFKGRTQNPVNHGKYDIFVITKAPENYKPKESREVLDFLVGMD